MIHRSLATALSQENDFLQIMKTLKTEECNMSTILVLHF